MVTEPLAEGVIIAECALMLHMYATHFYVVEFQRLIHGYKLCLSCTEQTCRQSHT